jgi:hypothetical protein
MNTREFQAPTTIEKRLEDFIDGSRPEEKIRAARDMVKPLLIAGEHIEHLLVQGLTAMKLHVGSVVLTNRRAIFLQPGLMKMAFQDLVWRNLHGVHLFETMTGGELVLQDVTGRVLRIGHLPKEGARRAYAYAQQLEEGALEFRRQRSLEESRAAAKGFAVPAHAPSEPALAPRLSTAPAEGGPVSALATLKDMLDRGLIDDATYQAKRTEILARL